MEVSIKHSRIVNETRIEVSCTLEPRRRVETRHQSGPIDASARRAKNAIPLGPVICDAEVTS